MKLFSLGALDAATSMAVLVRCPQIKGVESNNIKDWIRILRRKRASAWTNKRARMYNNCRKLLGLAEDCGAKIVSVYYLPCRKGHEIQFTFELGTEYAKKVFLEELYELDEELRN